MKELVIIEPLVAILLLSITVYSYVEMSQVLIKNNTDIQTYLNSNSTNDSNCSSFYTYVNNFHSSHSSFSGLLIGSILICIILIIFTILDCIYILKYKTQEVQATEKIQRQSKYVKFRLAYWASILLDALFIQVSFIGMIIAKNKLQKQSVECMSNEQKGAIDGYFQQFKKGFTMIIVLEVFIFLVLGVNLLLVIKCNKEQQINLHMSKTKHSKSKSKNKNKYSQSFQTSMDNFTQPKQTKALGDLEHKKNNTIKYSTVNDRSSKNYYSGGGELKNKYKTNHKSVDESIYFSNIDSEKKEKVKKQNKVNKAISSKVLYDLTRQIIEQKQKE